MRSDLAEWLTVSRFHWAGVEDEDAFLARLYDLKSKPSTDSRSRYPTAAEDIHQHRVRNTTDWPDDWVFTDSRFNLLHCSDEEFLAFLAATVRPMTQRNPDTAAVMVDGYNEQLRPLGWSLTEARRIGENIYYEARKVTGVHDPAKVVVAGPNIIDRRVLDEQLERLRRDIDSDPAAAIGQCKELLESQLKLVLRSFSIEVNDRDDLPGLYGEAARALGIHGEAVPGDRRGSDAVKGMLRNLASLVRNVAEARNSMGTGHGRADTSSAERRHARLVFNTTVAVTEFVADTWASRSETD
ncbi:abortive infection family protein [Curtobacterium sp. PhB136]|uniref:abortive infection family protein n=1 Tax=Curtobacterium sp. PhB136 TaxID=2485181 RepID=UPI001044950A|nr:abortive infection family protein [Curtobacterium sp. PhB136]TCK65771.1 abortive infection Abi-like protein [Curtobacterium sp. PhB136]